MTTTAASKNPEKFGRYEVEGLIGVGAMGRVFRGFDPLVRRAVAIKTFRGDELDPRAAEENLKRFRREAQAAGALSHPHIVSIFDVGENYFVMEYLEGKTLQGLIEEKGQLDAALAFELFAPVADALDYAHRRGVIHRDIKPGNIMVLPDGRAKLMDFGVAHLESSNMTKAGEVLGSPSYMAPEQIAGHEVTPKADLFSFATVAYQALTGQKPFQGETVTTVIYRVVHEDPPPPRKWNTALPSKYDDVFKKALSKDPEARFATAQAFMTALDLRAFDIDSDGVFTPPPASSPLTTASGTSLARTAEADHGDATMSVEAKGLSMPKGLAAPKAVPRKASPPLWPWILGALVLLAVAGAGLFFLRKPELAPTPQAAPQAAGLRIETDPAGATVSVDGKEVGVSPLSIPSLAPGLRTFRVFKDGYAPAELSLEITSDAALAPLHFTLQPTEAKASVVSQPQGATVYVDGHDSGKTPVSGLSLPIGPHEVRVEFTGYKAWRQKVDAKAGDTVSLEAKLEVQPPVQKKPVAEPEPTPPPLAEGDLVELSADVTPPKKLSGDIALYPPKAERDHMQGLVVVDFIVTEKGATTNLRIVESAGEVLDSAVLAAMKDWKFEPAKKNGIKVKVHQQFRQRFEIRK